MELLILFCVYIEVFVEKFIMENFRGEIHIIFHMGYNHLNFGKLLTNLPVLKMNKIHTRKLKIYHL